MIILIDMKTGQQTHICPPGPRRTLSWQRLVDLLRETGKLKADQVVTHLLIEQDGIACQIETEEKKP